MMYDLMMPLSFKRLKFRSLSEVKVILLLSQAVTMPSLSMRFLNVSKAAGTTVYAYSSSFAGNFSGCSANVPKHLQNV